MTTVVVIDDDITVRGVVQMILKKYGYQVHQAATADEAVRIIESLSISGVATSRTCIAIMDVMMPGVDGLTLCHRVKNEFGIPVIMLTARAGYDDVQAAFQSGADDYIIKPFSMQTLIEKVRLQESRFTHHLTTAGG